MIIDSHVHVASADRSRYPLDPRGVGSRWFEADDVGADDLLALIGQCGVGRAVVVQGIGAYAYDCSYAVDAVRDHSDRLCLVGAIDMSADEPEIALTALARAAGPSLRGIRLFGIGNPPPAWLTDGRGDAVWQTCRDLGIAAVPTLFPASLPSLARLMERYPDVPVVVEHIGFVDLAGGAPFLAAQPLFDLADQARLHVKVTTYSLEQAEEVGDPADLIDLLAELFGAGRLLWGSDFPQTARRTYPQMLQLAHHASRRLPPKDREMFLGGTAQALWWPA